MNFNAVNTILQLKDSLALTEQQLATLQPLSDSVAARNTALGAEFQKLLREAGANPDMGALMGRLQPRIQALQRQNDDLLKQVQAILTADQWAKVPPRVKNGGQARQRPRG